MKHAAVVSLGLAMACVAPACGDDDAASDAGPEEACEPSGLFCAADEYCDRGSRCVGPGRCVPRPDPSDCTGDGPLVCGCNGMEYDDACLAGATGVVVRAEGRCTDAAAP